MKMVFDRRITVERIVLPDMEWGVSFKEWKAMAAVALAEFILEHNLMTHHSKYDIEHQYTHEAFTCLVARPERKLP